MNFINQYRLRGLVLVTGLGLGLVLYYNISIPYMCHLLLSPQGHQLQGTTPGTTALGSMGQAPTPKGFDPSKVAGLKV